MTSSSNIPNSELRVPNSSVPAVLTVAGSDSGAGAGIQADLKTFAALGCYGTSAITCLTAQNPDRVDAVLTADPEFVAQQIKTVCDGFPVKAVKTGMLFSVGIIEAVSQCSLPPLVIDPVMVATSGARLLEEDAIDALQTMLLPKAAVITPNIPEAEILAGHEVPNLEAMRETAQELSEKFGTACVVKGGHLPNSELGTPPFAKASEGRGDSELENPNSSLVDILYTDGRVHEFQTRRIEGISTHGTGCTFSAAIAALLARGEELPAAVEQAQAFVGNAIANALTVGSHNPLNHFFKS